MRFLMLIVWAATLLFVSCENSLESYDPGFEGAEYFPLAVGHTWTYRVDSVVYDNAGLRIDSSSNLVRERITEQYFDEEGLENFRLERAVYNHSDGTWQVRDIWSASLEERHAYRNEENLRFAKLNFPVKEGKTWAGNAFIDENITVKIAGEPIKMFQNWGEYEYLTIGQAERIGELDHNSVCTVLQTDLEDKITRRYSLEKYASGTGLVYKSMMILNTQKFDSEQPWEIKAEEGFILEQTLLSFEP